MALTKISTGMLKQDAASSDLNIDAGTLYLDVSNNRVGIANTSPSQALDVTGNVVITGTVTSAGMTTSANINFGDNDKAIFGAGSDLQIYHSGSHSIIDEAGTGDLYLRSTNGDAVLIYAGGTTSSKKRISANSTGEVELYYGSTARLATTSTGIDVTGTAVTDGLTSAGDAAITGGSSGSTVLTLTSNALVDTPLMVFQRTGGAVAGKLAYEDTNTAMSFGTTTAHELKFLTSNTERTRITSAGNVGIGTNSPSSKFVVSDAGGAGLEFIPQTSNNRTTLLSYDRSANAYQTVDFDGSDIHFNIAGTERMRLDASGNVGIGTSSPGAPIHVETIHEIATIIQSSNNNGTHFVIRNSDATTGRKALINLAPANNITGAYIGAEAMEDFSTTANRTADLFFSTRNNGTLSEKMRINSSGYVGIGTSSPLNPLHVKQSGGSHLLALETAYVTDRSGRGQLSWRDSGNITGGIWTEYDGSQVSMRFGNLYNSGYNTNTSMIIRGNGNVGIGTDSPSAPLTVNSDTGAGTISLVGRASDGYSTLAFRNNADDTTLAALFADDSSDDLQVHVAGSERMRIDSSGNLLVGQSSSIAPASDDTVGVAISPTGYISAHRTGVSAEFGRNTSDGDIINFRKDGTTVGSIGVKGGDLGIGLGTAGLRFFDQQDSILPYNATTQASDDNVVNLGRSANRFKDLYLSGTANVGSATVLGTDATDVASIGTAAQRVYIKPNGTEIIYNASGNSAGHHVWQTGNAERMRIDSSGNVGIGTSSPQYITEIGKAQSGGVGPTLYLHNTVDAVATGHAAEIRFNLRAAEATTRNAAIQAVAEGSYGTSPALTFLTSSGTSGSATERMRIDASGSVGINNTVASTINSSSGFGNLVVGSGSGNEGITIYTGSSSFGGLNFADATSGGGAYAGYIKFDHSDNSFGHFIGNTERMRIDSAGTLILSGNGGSPANSIDIAYNGISGHGSFNVDSGGGNTFLTFGTSSSGSLAERMRITSAGNVGIGVSNPLYMLHMNGGSSRTDVQVTLDGYGEGANDGAQFGIQTQGAYIWNYENTDLYFATNNQRRLTINEDGNVGIGDTTPDEKLSVYGAVTSSYQAVNFAAGPYRAHMDIIYATKKVRIGSIQGSNTPTGSEGEVGIYVNSGEKVTIDTSGNLMVGKTSSNYTVAGAELRDHGTVGGTTTTQTPFFANRTTNDGALFEFYRGAGTVGIISTRGTNLSIGSGDVSLEFNHSNDAVLPSSTSTNNTRDAAVDLGIQSVRFKDLYLSGSVITGGNTTNNFGSIDFKADSVRARIIGGYASGGGGYLKFHTDSTGGSDLERMRLDSSGNLLVGTTDKTLVGRTDTGRVCIDNEDGNDCLQLKGSGVNHLNIASWIPISGGGYHIGFGDGTGSYTERGVISTDGSVTNYGGTSDYRLKENVIQLTGAINRVKMLSPSRFNFIDKPEQMMDGFIAHEVQAVVPEAVVGEKDALKEDGSIRPQQLDNSKLVPLLTAALQEALEKIDNLESRLLQLEQ